MNLEFLDELVEARLYRNVSTLTGKSAKDLAKIFYLSVLMLEVLRHRDESWAKKYATDTLGYSNFDNLRSYATDLHNLMAVLDNQEDFSDKIKTDKSVTVPVFAVKRWLRDIQNDVDDYYISRQLFIKLEGTLKISDSSLKSYRRIVGDWHSSSESERKKVTHDLRLAAQHYPQTTDLSKKFIDHSKD